MTRAFPRGFVHHLDLTVTNLARSIDFYARVLPLLGFRRIADCTEGPLWSGELFELGLQEARGPNRQRLHDRYSPGLHHLAFGAQTRGDVDRVHRELVALGIEILDDPTEYPEYCDGYYAVFFRDPDGMKLEYVHTPVWPV
jgi:catechol 2,3-dioxygenase-like lactoylglutathione lyase family enzyme